MHEHEWKAVSRREAWKESPEPGLLMAYEVKINRCDCGEERKIKTAPKGIWWKGTERHLERVKTYPENWKETLADYIAEAVNSEITVTLDRFGRSGLLWAEAEELVQSLVVDGIAERFERYPKHTPKDTKICIPGENLQILRVLLGLNKREEEEKAVTAFFSDWEKLNIPDTPAGNIINKLAELWRLDKKPVLPLRDSSVSLRSLHTYKLLLDTLKTIALLNLSAESTTFRELSIRVTGDSKGLASIKPYLKRILGDLEDYGIKDHSPLLFCRIPMTGEIHGRHLDLSAAADYTVLTESTVLGFKPVHSDFQSLLLIENQTTFEATVARLPRDMGCVFLAGYPPGHVQSFIKNLLKFHPVPGQIWCDIDPDGIEIALIAGKWFEEVGQSWQPLGMDRERLLEATTMKTIDGRDREKLKILKTRPGAKVFRELIDEMEKIGKKVEQEVIGPEKILAYHNL